MSQLTIVENTPRDLIPNRLQNIKRYNLLTFKFLAMKSLNKIILGLSVLLFYSIHVFCQEGYQSTIIRNIEMLDVGPVQFFDEADAMFDKVMKPVVLNKEQLKTRKGFVFTKVKGLEKTNRNWLKKNGYTATDDLWIVVPEIISSKGTIDIKSLIDGVGGFQLKLDTPSAKLSCGIACEGHECVEKKCGNLPKRRCISCSGCCESHNGIGGSSYLIPSYETIN